MHPGPRLDSRNFDIAVGDNDYVQQPSGAQPLRQIKIRNSGDGTGVPYVHLIGQTARQEMRMVRD
jgi:hypothetical protein